MIFPPDRFCIENTFNSAIHLIYQFKYFCSLFFSFLLFTFFYNEGTVVPISSLAQYTTAPTFRSGYILNSDSVMQRPPNMGTPPTSIPSNSETYLCQQYQQQQLPHSAIPLQTTSNNGLTSTTATLRRMKQANIAVSSSASPPPPTSAATQRQLQQTSMTKGSTSTYDGLAPRTLSTGVAVNSQFYYG